jgi:hypothetical protein
MAVDIGPAAGAAQGDVAAVVAGGKALGSPRCEHRRGAPPSRAACSSAPGRGPSPTSGRPRTAGDADMKRDRHAGLPFTGDGPRGGRDPARAGRGTPRPPSTSFTRWQVSRLAERAKAPRPSPFPAMPVVWGTSPVTVAGAAALRDHRPFGRIPPVAFPLRLPIRQEPAQPT